MMADVLAVLASRHFNLLRKDTYDRFHCNMNENLLLHLVPRLDSDGVDRDNVDAG